MTAGWAGADLQYTLGIDLASQPETTAACLLGWYADHAEVVYLERHRERGAPGARLDDTRLVELMLGTGVPGRAPAKTGIDAPLGWPVRFVEAVADPDHWPLDEDNGPMVRRRTDHWIHREFNKVPLSVSTDRIAYPAMRAQRLLRRYHEATGATIDRSGVAGPICEVYPDVGVSRFGLRPEGTRRISYKGAAGQSARAGLLSALERRAPWLALSARHRTDCVAADDSFDALIAALIARAVQRGLTLGPPLEMVAEAAVEGWVHVPGDGGLAAIAPGLPGPPLEA